MRMRPLDESICASPLGHITSAWPDPPVACLRRQLGHEGGPFQAEQPCRAACLFPLVRRKASSIRRCSNSSTAWFKSMPSSLRVRPRDLLVGDEGADVWRQILDANDVVLAQHHHALDEILQFTHVAGPVVLPQVHHGFVGDPAPGEPARRALCFSRKYCTSTGMSERRSRSGGTGDGMTCSR